MAPAECRGDDWPYWLGPNHDSVWREQGILTELPAEGPKIKWRVPVGIGYTGPAVAQGRVYLIDREAGERVEGEKGAAELLGLNPSTLRSRMRKLDIKRPDKKAAD